MLSFSKSIDLGSSSVNWLGHTCLSFPVGSASKSISFGLSIILDWGGLLVSTTKHARLELLVFTVTRLKACLLISLFHWRSLIGCLHTWVLPVCSRGHQGTILLVLLVSVHVGSFTVQFSCLGRAGLWHITVWPVDCLWLTDHDILG